MLSMFQNAYLEQSIQFAEKVEREFKGVSQRKSRGVKQAGFVVLKETTMPSVLIETGFLSNNKEENYLYTEKGQNEVSASILHAFTNYRKEVEGSIANVVAYDNTEVQTSPPVTSNSRPKEVTVKTANEVYYTINEPKSYNYNPPAPQTAAPNPPALKSRELSANDIFQPEEKSTNYATYPGIDYQSNNSHSYNVPVEYSTQKTSSGNLRPKSPEATTNTIDFRVQLAASPYVLNTNSVKWMDTGYMIEVIQEDNLYKYQACNLTSFHQAQAAKADLRQRGFSDAFIVAYRDGQRISMDEAKKATGSN